MSAPEAQPSSPDRPRSGLRPFRSEGPALPVLAGAIAFLIALVVVLLAAYGSKRRVA
jgi:hypothetical protein